MLQLLLILTHTKLRGNKMKITTTELLQRINKIQQKMLEQKLEMIIVYSEVNRFYLTNFNCSYAIIVIEQQSTPRFYTDARYLESAKVSISHFEIHNIKDFDAIFDYANKNQIKNICVEASITSDTYISITEKFTNKIELTANKIFNEVRAVKSEVEIELIRSALLISDNIFNNELKNIKAGITELSLYKNIEIEAIKQASGSSFNTIVCFGENTAYPHYTSKEFILKNDMPICIDMGVKNQHYCSDMTRTFFYGDAHKKLEEFYNIVYETLVACAQFIKPGITCKTLDELARKIIGDAGYAELFGHGLGHGIGLNVHEYPLLSKDKNCELEEGMAFTLEPGIYMPGIGGVRIEDIVVVTKSGCEILTTTSKNFLTIQT